MHTRGLSQTKNDSVNNQQGTSFYKTLWKNRIQSSTLSNQNKNGKTRQLYPNSCMNQQQFNCTANELFDKNFQHHDPTICVCDYCTCGRHFCKMHAMNGKSGPGMSLKGSHYQRAFGKKNSAKPKIIIAPDAPKLWGNHLQMNSTQRQDFLGRKGDINERPKPQDLLKTNGFSQNITSYSSQFPGHKGSNQYVKPTDKHYRDSMPLQAKTTYGEAFTNRPNKASSLAKTPDNLRTGSLWLGKSTYGNYFQQPNPQNYATKVIVSEKLQQKTQYPHQYQTIYKNDFLKSQSKVCQAKILLQSKLRGKKLNLKDKFTQNGDFKSLSPEFHAISTSKHSYV